MGNFISLEDEVEYLRAEIQRLRDALTKIAAQSSGLPGSAKLSDCLAAWASKALGSDESNG